MDLIATSDHEARARVLTAAEERQSLWPLEVEICGARMRRYSVSPKSTGRDPSTLRIHDRAWDLHTSAVGANVLLHGHAPCGEDGARAGDNADGRVMQVSSRW